MSESVHAIRTIDIDADALTLTLSDGRVLREPLKRHVRLEKATPAERLHWVLVDDGHGLDWPALWPSSDEGMVNVFTLCWEQLQDEGMAALKAADWQLDALPLREQQLAALWRLEADVNNGGFLQFFCNWGEATCRTAVTALTDIGALQMHSLVQQMRAVLDRLDGSPKIQALMDLYQQLSPAELDTLETLDEAFWAYPDRLSKLGVLHFERAVPPSVARPEGTGA